MSACINCGRYLSDADFEKYDGYCPNCILLESRDYAYKSFKLLMFFIIGAAAIIVTSIEIIISLIFITDQYQLVFMVPPGITLISSSLICAYCLKRFKQEEIHL